MSFKYFSNMNVDEGDVRLIGLNGRNYLVEIDDLASLELSEEECLNKVYMVVSKNRFGFRVVEVKNFLTKEKLSERALGLFGEKYERVLHHKFVR